MNVIKKKVCITFVITLKWYKKYKIMYRSTITVKGQTTIPLDIRKKLNLSAGDNIEYYTNDNNTVTIFNSNLDIHDLCGILPKPSKIVTIEEMKEVINKRRGESDRH